MSAPDIDLIVCVVGVDVIQTGKKLRNFFIVELVKFCKGLSSEPKFSPHFLSIRNASSISNIAIIEYLIAVNSGVNNIIYDI